MGRDRGLVNCSAAAGRAPNWTGRALNSPYQNAFRDTRPGEIITHNDALRVLSCDVPGTVAWFCPMTANLIPPKNFHVMTEVDS